MKKLTAILLATLMLVSIFASCGGNDETTTTEIPTTEAPTTEAPTTETPTTETPTTEAPTTEAPTTEASTTNNNDNIDNVENPWDSILIDSYYNNPRFNCKNTFDSSLKYFDNSDNVSPQVTINVNGENIIFDHDESRYDKMTGVITNEYKKEMDGGYYYLWLYKDGTVKLLSKGDGLASIEIPKNASSEEVLPFAKEFLSQFTDLSQYNNTEYKIDGLGDYTFKFYRVVNGYITGWAEIEISAEGKITRIFIEKIQDEITSLNVNWQRVEEFLYIRIKDIFTTDFVEFISCDKNRKFPPRAYIINDQIYLYYTYDVEYKFKDESGEHYLKPIFLVPYELVKAE